MIEADVQRFFHVDTTELWRGTLSMRKLRVLIEHLPSDSIAARAIAGVDEGALRHWSLTDALLGRVVDELALLRWEWESAHLAKRQRHRPEPKSVLPKVPEPQRDATVIPLVQPIELRDFMSDVEGS